MWVGIRAMTWDRVIKLMQLLGAALAVPAGAAGVYSAYRTYFSADVACQNLRGAILATMEKNIGPDAKRTLLRKDVAEFEKTCGNVDPDARAIFQATIQQLEAQAAAPPTGQGGKAAPQEAAVSGAARPGLQPLAGFLAGPDRRGWVSLGRRDGVRPADFNFDGYAVSARSLPPAGTILTARWPVPMWGEPQDGPRPDLSQARALLRAGMCVRVISARAGEERLWAEIVAAPCS
jgi:hypothetical protein